MHKMRAHPKEELAAQETGEGVVLVGKRLVVEEVREVVRGDNDLAHADIVAESG